MTGRSSVKIAVIGSGGREHALLWKLSKQNEVKELIAIPGNGGTLSIASSLTPNGNSVEALADSIRSCKPDLVIVGPEQPLAEGIADTLMKSGIPCFGPSALAARIESSKVFSKELMRKYSIPTAEFEIFDDFDKLASFIRQNPCAYGRVAKADGLAAGKGAFVCSNDQEAIAVAKQLLVDDSLGAAGHRIVLEEKLFGTEASAHFWCDGEHFAPLPVARDYKRALDDDLGPNTGGMGTLCPAGHVSADMLSEIGETIIAPTLSAMQAEGCPYRGVLYAGLMLTDDGPRVIEFNCRFGDPETQVMLPLMQDNLIETMLSCIDGTLKTSTGSPAASGAAVCVVLTAEGYPGSYRKDIPLRTIENTGHTLLFHAGTTMKDGKLVSSGGRIFNAVGLGSDIETARLNAYQSAHSLLVSGLRFRSDIAATAK
ncbi:phosphoribosylamine--glycine ligase [bacterium]|nr:phosphoribosylamine--glycine ligase [bacterium]